MRNFILDFKYSYSFGIRPYKTYQQRVSYLLSLKPTDVSLTQTGSYKHQESNIANRMKRSDSSSKLRPIEGPINIEQLPAMLAARNVKRYPYSQQDDPAIM